MILITMSSSNHLYLTQVEADSLADHLRQTLICRTVDQADDLVMVADICLTTNEAWKLVDRLNNLATEEVVDWPSEGF